MLRDITLSLEPNEYAIFYHWNYSPPVKNIGGELGCIYHDGALFGLSFDDLNSLGSGTHNIQMDERNRTPHGTRPKFDNERGSYELFKLALFGYEHGVFTQTEVLMRALLSFTPAYSDAVLAMASDELLASLVEHAAQVPGILKDAPSIRFRFWSSTGETQIPEQNLVLLHRKLAS
ncbi:MAG: hypothetical protein KDB14_03540 [Planctomycetales bacterium]|nr:hypothetical protein [Planctomycetales bacterium]